MKKKYLFTLLFLSAFTMSVFATKAEDDWKIHKLVQQASFVDEGPILSAFNSMSFEQMESFKGAQHFCVVYKNGDEECVSNRLVATILDLSVSKAKSCTGSSDLSSIQELSADELVSYRITCKGVELAF